MRGKKEALVRGQNNDLPCLSPVRKVGIIAYLDYQTVKVSATEEDLLDQVRDGDVSHINGLDQYLFVYLGTRRKVLLKVVSSGLSEHAMGFGEVGKVSESVTICTIPLGTIVGGEIHSGISDLPPVGSAVYSCSSSELQAVFCLEHRCDIRLGNLLGYLDIIPNLSVDCLLSSHTAILGNTGAGKSTTTRSLLSQVHQAFVSGELRYGAQAIVLDVHGDYSCIKVDMNVTFDSLYIPVGELTKEDWFSLLSPSEKVQRPLLERGLEYSLLNEEGQNLLCAALAELAIRDPSQDSSGSRWIQVDKYFSKVVGKLDETAYFKKEVCKEKNFQIGKGSRKVIYTSADLMNCFRLNFGDYPEDLVDTLLKVLRGYLQKYLDESGVPSTNKIVADQNLRLKPASVCMDNVLSGIDFVFAEEQVRGNRQSRAYSEGLVARIKNFSSKYGDGLLRQCEGKTSLSDIVCSARGVTVINLSGEIDGDGLRLVSSFLARRLLAKNASVPQNERKPTTLVLEEAHRYVLQMDDGEDTVFERIAREGRKFGIYLMLISQIPSELSKVVLAQCGLFIIHRIQNQADLQFLSKNVPSMTASQLTRLPTFSPGDAAIFGSSLRIPFEVAIDGKGFSDATPSVSFLST